MQRRGVAVAGLTAFLSVVVPVVSFTAAGAGRVAPGRAPDLTILFTGDVVGYIEPCG